MIVLFIIGDVMFTMYGNVRFIHEKQEFGTRSEISESVVKVDRVQQEVVPSDI